MKWSIASQSAPEPGAPGAAPAPSRTAVIVVAARDIPALAPVEGSAVETREVPKDAVPEGALLDPVQAIGKVPLMALGQGRALTTGDFAPAGSSAHLAAALGEGRRAVNVSLNGSTGIEDLLYPGCLVDVLFSMSDIGGDEDGGQPVSLTLMDRVQVLAVGGRTIVNPDGDEGGEDESRSSRSSSRGAPRVTLLVDALQAEKLNLAMGEGSISLALRNPADMSSHAADGTLLASLSPAFARTPKAQPEPTAPRVREVPVPAAPVAREPTWETVIVRGGQKETKTFALPENGRDP